MTTPLNCPVCDRTGVTTNICPNCETDLTSLRLVVDLPPASPPRPWLFPLLTFLGLLVGLGLGLGLNRPSPMVMVNPPVTPPTIESPILLSPEPVVTKDCGGFYYTVQEGDSLSLLSLRFYGDWSAWPLITRANNLLQNRQDLLYVGEKLLIPNLPDNCPIVKEN